MLKANTRVWVGVGLAAVALVAAVVYFLAPKPPPEEGAKHFRDAAEESGLVWKMRFLSTEQGEPFKVNLYDHGTGVAVADFDGDGHDDIYLVNQLGTNALYRNKGDGTFEDVTKKTGVGLGDRICTSATFADYANEGRQSLFVTSTRGGNVLFRNMGNGVFKDVTKEIGLEHIGHSQAGYFFDYDNDGYLDLLVLQTGGWTEDQYNEPLKYWPGKGRGPNPLTQIATSPKEFNILYHNEPDGKGGRRFVKAAKSGLEGRGWAADAAIFDYNGDGRMDVVVTSMFGRAQLYRNEGGGKFTDVTKEVLGRTPAGGMGVRAFDIDNDGQLDLYIVDMHSDMWFQPEFDPELIDEKKKYHYMFISDEMAKKPETLAYEKRMTDTIGLRYDEVLFGNSFHRNQGGGKFKEMSDQANLETFWPWGIATGDFDNDGYEDAFIPSGMGYPWGYWPNRLLMNKGDGTFQDRSREEGVEPPAQGEYLPDLIGGKVAPRSSRSAATADFDGDGRLDMVVNNFNDRPYYFKNSFPKKTYLTFRLRGVKSNRDAIGAVVRVHAGSQIMTRQVNTLGGYMSQSSKTLHFGLGDRTAFDKVEIVWPSGIRQTLKDLKINTRHDVTEPDK